jgi:hypothetical protein
MRLNNRFEVVIKPMTWLLFEDVLKIISKDIMISQQVSALTCWGSETSCLETGSIIFVTFNLLSCCPVSSIFRSFFQSLASEKIIRLIPTLNKEILKNWSLFSLLSISDVLGCLRTVNWPVAFKHCSRQLLTCC